MTDFLNPIAELDKPDSGKIILPTQAIELKAEHSFYCPDFDCKDAERILTVKKSSKGNYFFSHKPNCGHDIRPETLLHKLAIKWFLDKVEYEWPANKILRRQTVHIDPLKTICEFRKLERIIPDVTLTTDNDINFAIEIVVTNDIHESKAKLIKEFNLPTIRVDLTTFYRENTEKCQTDLEFIQVNLDRLMTDVQLKSWVIPVDNAVIKEKFEFTETSANNGCVTVLAGLGILLLLKHLLK